MQSLRYTFIMTLTLNYLKFQSSIDISPLLDVWGFWRQGCLLLIFIWLSDSNYSLFIHCASFGELCNTLETLAMWNEYRGITVETQSEDLM